MPEWASRTTGSLIRFAIESRSPSSGSVRVVIVSDVEVDELITLDEPWKVTLDLPAWTRKRDYYREVSGSDM